MTLAEHQSNAGRARWANVPSAKRKAAMHRVAKYSVAARKRKAKQTT